MKRHWWPVGLLGTALFVGSVVHGQPPGLGTHTAQTTRARKKKCRLPHKPLTDATKAVLLEEYKALIAEGHVVKGRRENGNQVVLYSVGFDVTSQRGTVFKN